LDYDSDCDEPPKDERLDWRQNPKESQSDWTIETIEVDKNNKSNGTDNNPKKNVYHVHKNMLVVKKCGYFARLFLGKPSSEAQSAHSLPIELHPLAATAFPQFSRLCLFWQIADYHGKCDQSLLPWKVLRKSPSPLGS